MRNDQQEKVLLERCSKGDREAFSFLYIEYLQPLYRHTYLFLKCRESSEEIVQDVFIKLWEKRADLIKIKSFRSYVYHMTKNMVMDHIRRSHMEYKALNRIQPQSDISENTSENLLIYKDYLGIAQEAINQLTEKRRTIFLMRTQQDLSIDQIAADLHISRSVVKKQYYTSVTLVREHIEKQTQLTSGMLIAVAFFF